MTLLIERGAALDARTHEDCTALWMASQAGAIATARVLIQYGIGLDEAGTVNLVTPLWIASQNGHLEVG